MDSCAYVKVPMGYRHKILLDLTNEAINDMNYREMIGLLLYLTASLPNILFSTFLCERLQANMKNISLDGGKTNLLIPQRKKEPWNLVSCK